MAQQKSCRKRFSFALPLSSMYSKSSCSSSGTGPVLADFGFGSPLSERAFACCFGLPLAFALAFAS
eukprot:2067731-Pyramimonas_sp.AAC.1